MYYIGLECSRFCCGEFRLPWKSLYRLLYVEVGVVCVVVGLARKIKGLKEKENENVPLDISVSFQIRFLIIM